MTKPIEISLTMTIVDQWLYDAITYGSDAAHLADDVRADLEQLPVAGE